MEDRLTDMTFVTSIYEASGVDYFSNDIRQLLLVVIKELCETETEMMLQLRVEHIDRAITKYTQAKKQQRIWNTKQYFKACIISAIRELGLEEIYHE